MQYCATRPRNFGPGVSFVSYFAISETVTPRARAKSSWENLSSCLSSFNNSRAVTCKAYNKMQCNTIAWNFIA